MASFLHSITSFSNITLRSSSSTSIPQPFRAFTTRKSILMASSQQERTIEKPEKFTIVGESIQHARYLTIFNQTVQFPDNQQHDFDIVGHPRSNYHFSVVFPFHSAPESGRWQDGTVTVLREYCQGINQMAYNLPTGSFNPKTHASYEATAKAELSEEAHLQGGTLMKLLDEGVGVPEVKWCRNRFTPFIVIDPEVDTQPGARDKEEYIQILRVSIPELRRIMKSGEMMLPSVSTCWWALEYLMENVNE